MMSEDLLALLSDFRLDSKPLFCEPYGSGHIHDSFLAGVSSGRRYILQKINQKVFPCVTELMENITAVTEFLKQKRKDPYRVLSLVMTSEGESFLHRGQSFWRLYEFVEGTICLQHPESDEDFFQSAVGFGNFQQMLEDFPVDKLHETIPDFHNTPKRFETFLNILASDPLDRASGAEKEIDFVLDRCSEMDTLTGALTGRDIPLRVTHNDTKLNNVLLDAVSRKACCVIDLDTVMPGSSLYDFGDSIRFGAATAAEDEKDLSRMEINLTRFRVFTRGFYHALPSLTDNEIMLLSSGAKIMTLECGMRFLTDYLEGDRYFSTHRQNQNLDRARTQLKLVADMEKKWSDMQRIVKEETTQARWK